VQGGDRYTTIRQTLTENSQPLPRGQDWLDLAVAHISRIRERTGSRRRPAVIRLTIEQGFPTTAPGVQPFRAHDSETRTRSTSQR